MPLGFMFFFNSILLGIGLAMDAFSVSVANGLKEPFMKLGKMCFISGIFALFQAAMPLTGWICVHTIAQHFKQFEKIIPWIALILLFYIGGKMLYDAIKHNDTAEANITTLGLSTLIMQGVATSIDALSVGFTIADYDFISALLSVAIIAVVTFVICFIGIIIGKGAGTLLSSKAGIFGGCILIFIGIEIFVSSFIN